MPEKASTIIQAIVIITSIFVLVAIFVIAYILYFNKRKRAFLKEKKILQEEFDQQLRQSQIEVQEQTYQRIGKELHDNVGQLLSTSRMLLGLTERSLPSPPDTLLTANATLGEAIGELRALSKSLDKEWLEQFNFHVNLQTEVARVNSAENVKAQYIENGRIELDADKQIILFRIVQEAIQNAIKHATPKNIVIETKKEMNSYSINVSDDGCGMSQSPSGRGMGIINMKHRITLLGGNISWDSAAGSGTTVVISLPIKNEI